MSMDYTQRFLYAFILLAVCSVQANLAFSVGESAAQAIFDSSVSTPGNSSYQSPFGPDDRPPIRPRALPGLTQLWETPQIAHLWLSSIRSVWNIATPDTLSARTSFRDWNVPQRRIVFTPDRSYRGRPFTTQLLGIAIQNAFTQRVETAGANAQLWEIPVYEVLVGSRSQRVGTLESLKLMARDETVGNDVRRPDQNTTQDSLLKRRVFTKRRRNIDAQPLPNVINDQAVDVTQHKIGAAIPRGHTILLVARALDSLWRLEPLAAISDKIGHGRVESVIALPATSTKLELQFLNENAQPRPINWDHVARAIALLLLSENFGRLGTYQARLLAPGHAQTEPFMIMTLL